MSMSTRACVCVNVWDEESRAAQRVLVNRAEIYGGGREREREREWSSVPCIVADCFGMGCIYEAEVDIYRGGLVLAGEQVYIGSRCGLGFHFGAEFCLSVCIFL